MTDTVSVSRSSLRFAQISQMVTAAIIRPKIKDLSWKQTICFLGGSAVTLYLVYSWFLPSVSKDELVEKAHPDVRSVRRRRSSRPRTFSSTKSYARTYTSSYNLGIPYPELSESEEDGVFEEDDVSEEDGVFNADPNYIPNYFCDQKEGFKMKPASGRSTLAENNEDEVRDPLYPRGKNTLENLREIYQKGELPSTLQSCLADQTKTG